VRRLLSVVYIIWNGVLVTKTWMWELCLQGHILSIGGDDLNPVCISVGRFWILTQFSDWFSQWELVDMVDCENWMENWSLVLRPVLTVRTGWHVWLWESDGEPISGSRMNKNQLWSFLFLFLRTEQVLSKNLHPVLGSLGFKVLKQSPLPMETEALFRVRDKECV
jgi:hypothetical protein